MDGNGSSSASVGHGLNAEPGMIIIKVVRRLIGTHNGAVDANGRYQVYLNKPMLKLILVLISLAVAQCH